jgi:hypothetical protein
MTENESAFQLWLRLCRAMRFVVTWYLLVDSAS